jgi:hypothetical protein
MQVYSQVTVESYRGGTCKRETYAVLKYPDGTVILGLKSRPIIQMPPGHSSRQVMGQKKNGPVLIESSLKGLQTLRNLLAKSCRLFLCSTLSGSKT